jgi:hypothetical protein
MFDPYHIWLGIPPDEQPPHHYRLLGIRIFEDNVEVIAHAADQRMAHLRTFQTAPNLVLSGRVRTCARIDFSPFFPMQSLTSWHAPGAERPSWPHAKMPQNPSTLPSRLWN